MSRNHFAEVYCAASVGIAFEGNGVQRLGYTVGISVESHEFSVGCFSFHGILPRTVVEIGITPSAHLLTGIITLAVVNITVNHAALTGFPRGVAHNCLFRTVVIGYFNLANETRRAERTESVHSRVEISRSHHCACGIPAGAQ